MIIPFGNDHHDQIGITHHHHWNPHNDAKIEGQALSRMVNASEKSGAGVVGSVLVGPNGHGFAYGYDGGHPILRAFFFIPIIRSRPTNLDNRPDFWNCPWVSGAGFLVRACTLRSFRTKFDRYLEEQFFAYHEELEFCLTANSLGYRVITARGAAISHCGGRSSGGKHSPVAYYYSTRNHILLGRRMVHVMARPLFHAFHFVNTLGRLLKNAAHGRLSVLVAIMSGYKDGLIGITGKWHRHDEMAPLQPLKVPSAPCLPIASREPRPDRLNAGR